VSKKDDDYEQQEAERGHEIVVLRGRLNTELRNALAAVNTVARTRQMLVDAYDVEHAEDGIDDLGHFIEAAARALRAASAVNPTSQQLVPGWGDSQLAHAAIAAAASAPGVTSADSADAALSLLAESDPRIRRAVYGVDHVTETP
jgi:hypothetical protein